MIYFKTCPRCRGDMIAHSDQYGRYMTCLQCGYEVEADKIARPDKVAVGTGR